MAASQLSPEISAQLAERLAGDPAVVLPARVAAQGTDRQVYLQQLLCSQPSIVLERHGQQLSEAELQLFQPLGECDYEVS